MRPRLHGQRSRRRNGTERGMETPTKPAYTVTLEQIKAVGQMVTTIGGFRRLHEMLSVVKEVGGLQKFKDLLGAIEVSGVGRGQTLIVASSAASGVFGLVYGLCCGSHTAIPDQCQGSPAVTCARQPQGLASKNLSRQPKYGPSWGPAVSAAANWPMSADGSPLSRISAKCRRLSPVWT